MQDTHLEMRLRTEYRYNDEMKENGGKGMCD